MMVTDAHVLYCDNHLLCVNKPAGMLTQGDRTGDLDLLSWARRYVEIRYEKPGRAYLGLVHRLDRPVSGLVVFARTSKSAARLSRQFRDREVTKRYVAMVEGVPKRTGKLKGRVQRSALATVVSSLEGEGKIAELQYRILLAGEDRALIDVELLTGRKHQIRAQLADAGNPIVGDVKYGAQMRFHGKTVALHCYHLAVEHPTRAHRIGWTVGPPDSWSQIWPSAASTLADMLTRMS